MRKKLSLLIVMAASFILCAHPLHVRADDGGGDGGSGDGGSGDGSGTDTGSDGTGDGGTDSTGTDGESNGDTTTADDAPDAPSIDPSAAVAPPSTEAPTVSPLDAIQSEATTDPRGNFLPVNETEAGTTGGIPFGGPPTKAAVDVHINAVIVSAAQSPWDAIAKAPGVGNVFVTGGIIAMGKTPIDGEISGGGPQPLWLRLSPDLRMLKGSAIPPVVPNVIDIRILSCPIQILYPNEEKGEY